MLRGDLIDTSALIALVRERDPWHQPCGGLAEHVWAFVRSGRMAVAPIADVDLPTLERPMRRYADRPMDFADATLVHVAEREGLRTILTIDHADFETYRIGRNAKFRILPAR